MGRQYRTQLKTENAKTRKKFSGKFCKQTPYDSTMTSEFSEN